MTRELQNLLTKIHDSLEVAAHNPAKRQELRAAITEYVLKNPVTPKFVVKTTRGFLVRAEGSERADATEEEATLFETRRDAEFWLDGMEDTVVEVLR